jgi:hypothetical protein
VKIGKGLSGAMAVLAATLAPLALAGPVAANGVGDLYVASSVGVLEIHVATATIVSTIPLLPAPAALAFSPDGRQLYVAGGDAQLNHIDIATLGVEAPIPMPGPVTAIAYPSGATVVATMPTRRTLAFVALPASTVTESAQLPGPGNLVTADRRDPRALVAEAGGSWLAVVDPGTSSFKKTTITGEIRAVAVERDRGGALVATTKPDSLIRVDLTTLAVDWTVALPGTPAAVAAMKSGAVVAVAATLYAVDGKKATSFAPTRSAATALVASDEGQYVHAQLVDAIEVFDAAGKLQRTLELAGDRAPLAMASVTRGSSLFLGEGDVSSPGTTAAGTAGPNATGKPPSTSTIVDTAADLASQPPVRGALAVGLAILVLYAIVYRRFAKGSSRLR